MFSYASSPSSPSSVYSNEEKITRTMGDVIKDYDIEELIDYLQRKEKLERYGMLGEPTTRIIEFIKNLNETNYVISHHKNLWMN
ncbi:hypothetical protein F8M41_010930 [Gigaspora margarita]|uniref:Uncharacterized protein n=1 Tax=Gigaspora margarita TaxID=4874 RepID=A0A8H4A0N4_GIGMA|nr:hypothetical protein F8M41_010930 [Gigaspora margarita]